ncbi:MULTISPECIES: acetylornithine deacetylase/succinyl-diaminopimelate desuccinylase family protein [unclassified Mesorhizobium]|uniref:acetylornithine deacetylase/succinyl-diaminopimelate desuccinylase family protein n=1 Tax=unclassified Mesorhizobium TaxID=325217 RepID=UPI000BB07A4C|nr:MULTISPECIES: acetylornithine deacetylase/succinyl-diaminopimelate desuccinylase family protein [unclassified Mesorhizobium]TGT59425.1 acetylornithine deacetylase/succinyl-diaminopimelate desuccinylase family protein [Mesorhizobium sp. M00.F.Ca.ET.170.01.1.1]AZO12432.1 acetylornithine deacetylase/succinyl-diaminopimelate desuccinylase family protein [Mesorhizobium sp. M3A.F.Ca.ET.080.04.2.1]PBB85931.1 succinyl-diaminopimelate desuccinylase [Mesorhizobium sp. WSM3876]RWB69401.1 MAG: acetylorn
MKERLYKAVEDRVDDLIALTVDLIRFPTVNPPGEAYRPCAEYLGARLRKLGFEIDFIRAMGAPGDTDRYPRVNVVARLEGRSPGPCVHFNSHIDVVEAGDGWTVDPFAGLVKDGRVYGRGACDMKGGLAASVIAVEAFMEVYPDFPGAIEISGTADEESGGFGGVAHLANLGYFSKPKVDHVIIPEPLNKDRICLGHRGVWWAEIETKGEIAHGSMPFLGDNAVRHMGAVLQGFEDELFPALDRKVTRMPVVPEAARRSTMNINSIHGGQTEDFRPGLPSPNVPDSCRLTIDRRFLLEEDLATVKGEVTGILERLKRERKKFDYEIRNLMEVLPLMTERDAPVVKAVAQGIMEVFDREPHYVISPGTYDQKHVARIGHIYDCIAYGPGILDLAHRPDEWVGIADMVESAKVMAIGLNVLLRGTTD